MTETYAYLRTELAVDGNLPNMEVGGVSATMPKELAHRVYRCEQPDELDDAEFNLILHSIDGTATIRTQSIDWEFFTLPLKVDNTGCCEFCEVMLTDDDRGLYSVLDRLKNEFVEKEFELSLEAEQWMVDYIKSEYLNVIETEVNKQVSFGDKMYLILSNDDMTNVVKNAMVDMANNEANIESYACLTHILYEELELIKGCETHNDLIIKVVDKLRKLAVFGSFTWSAFDEQIFNDNESNDMSGGIQWVCSEHVWSALVIAMYEIIKRDMTFEIVEENCRYSMGGGIASDFRIIDDGTTVYSSKHHFEIVQYFIDNVYVIEV